MGFFFYKNSGRETSSGINEVAPIGSVTFTVLPMSGAAGTESEALSAPDGFLFCNGATLSSSTYNLLYDEIQNTFGGTYPNFRLPNYRLYFPTSVGLGFLLGVSSPGGSHSHSVDEHEHTITSHAHSMPSGYLTHTHSMNHPHALTEHGHYAGDGSGQLSSGIGNRIIESQAPGGNPLDTQARASHTHGDLSNRTGELPETSTSYFDMDTQGPLGSVSLTGYSGSFLSTNSNQTMTLGPPSPSSLPPYLEVNFMVRYI